MKLCLILVTAGLAVSGCTTISYNAYVPTVAVNQHDSCAKLTDDLSSLQAARAKVQSLGVENTASVMLDGGIGNVLAKRNQLKSIDAQIELVNSMSSNNGCK